MCALIHLRRKEARTMTMVDGSSTSEASKIFEVLFGGFSGGLSIFKNNPFRRKVETLDPKSAPGVLIESSPPGHSDAIRKATKRAAQLKEDRDPDLKKKSRIEKLSIVTSQFEPDGTEHSAEKHPERAKEVVPTDASAKTLKIEDEDGRKDDFHTGSSQSRKRKKGIAADGSLKNAGTVGNDESEAKKNKKKTDATLVVSERISRDSSDRTGKKRGIVQAEFAENAEQGNVKSRRVHSKNTMVQTPVGILITKQMGKRPQETEGDMVKKKTRIESSVRDQNRAAVGGEAIINRDTRNRKRKENGIEEKFEKRMKRMALENGTAVRMGESVADMDVVEKLKEKRKVSLSDEDDTRSQKRRRTKEQRIDDELKLRRTIFVGNLPVTVKRKHLVREFSQYGIVESARLRSVPLADSKLPRKAAVITGQLLDSRTSLNAYVVFQEEESAQAAIAHNMKEYGGKHLRVDMATAPRTGNQGCCSSEGYDSTRSIFVGNLPFDVEDEEVYALFDGKGNPNLDVEAVRVVRDSQTSMGKGFAFVLFKSQVGSRAALGRSGVILKNRRLRLVRLENSKKPPNSQSKMLKSYEKSRLEGAEHRIQNKAARGPLPWEGSRSTKGDGRPGKWTGSRVMKPKTALKGEKMASAQERPVKKRPAVAARKALALQAKSGGIPTPKLHPVGMQLQRAGQKVSKRKSKPSKK